MRTNQLGAALLALVIITAALALAGCGGGGDDGIDENGLCRIDDIVRPQEDCEKSARINPPHCEQGACK